MELLMKPLAGRSVHRLLRLIERVRTKDFSDEFIVRLCQVNPGLLERGNLLCFDYAMSRLGSRSPILEIGSFCGLSANCLTYYKQVYGKTNRIITIDRWDYSFKGLGQEPIGKSSITGMEWAQFARETFIRNVLFFCRNDLPWVIEASSDEFFERWEAKTRVTTIFGQTAVLGGEMSFCYIDGNHEYDQVKRDFTNCDRYLEKEGFILFDDSADYSGSPGVQELISELKATKIIGTSYELVMRNPNYLIKKVADGPI
jgi:hypothetical protein